MKDQRADGSLTAAQRDAIEAATAAVLDYRDGIAELPARPTAGLDEVVQRFRKPLAEEGQKEEDVIAHLVRQSADGLHQMSAPSFFGYVLGGSHPIGVAADMLVSG